MEKNVVTKTPSLKKLQKRLKRKNSILGIVDFILILFVWFVYAFFAITYSGRWQLSSNFPILVPTSWLKTISEWEWLKYLKYPSTINPLFEFNSAEKLDSIIRLSIFGGVLILDILLVILFTMIRNKSNQKKYKGKYKNFLAEELKLNGLTMLFDEEINKKMFDEAIKVDELKEVKMQNTFKIVSGSFIQEVVQMNYNYKDEKRPGIMIVSDLYMENKVESFFSIRSFGKLEAKEYLGHAITKTGFETTTKKQFVVYSSLGEDVSKMISPNLSLAVSNLQKFVKSNLLISIVNDKLTVFIDGWSLKIIEPYKVKVLDDILELKAQAIKGLYSAVCAVSIALASNEPINKESTGLN